MLKAAALAIVLAGSLAAPVLADEGLWTFDNFPAEKVKAKYGFQPDKAFLDRLRLGSGRYADYCSGGIVSPDGLIQTNFHCALECTEALLPAGKDAATTPFVALTQADERQCPGLTFEVLTETTDVTARIAAVTSGLDGEAYASRLNAEADEIAAECQGEAEDRTCEVVPLYQGAQQKLYTYRKYDDVRLVLGPEVDVGSFGGDPDNFNFPRFSLDVAFLRLYVDGRPAPTPDYLKWRSEPLAEGELLFVGGSPADTRRLWALSRIQFLKNDAIQFWLVVYAELRGRLIAFMAQNEAQRAMAAARLYETENTYKGWLGERNALAQPDAMPLLEAAERTLKEKVAADPALAAEIGDPWGEIAAVESVERLIYQRYRLVEDGAWGSSELFAHARELVRAAGEADKTAAGAYSEAALSVPDSVFANRRIEPKLEELLLAFWWSKVREFLGTDDPLVKKILGVESPEGLAERLTATTRLYDAAERRRLAEGGAKAVMESTDPMIVFVRSFDAEANALQGDFDARVVVPRRRADQRIAKARFKLFGDSLYPDATFSPRVSYGTVRGWTEPDGRIVQSFTTFAGLKARATGAEPYRLAPAWQVAIDRLSPDTIFNVSTDHDTVGGSSGSPVVDREGRVVGALFDGNIHGFGGFYFFDDKLNRSVIVASTAIEEALTKVYGLQRIVDELKR